MFARRVALLVALLMTIAGVASAASVTPSVIPGANNDGKLCSDVYGPGIVELRVPGTTGTYTSGGLSVTVVAPSTGAGSLNSFDFTSNKLIEGVIVKDGVDGANWYNYQPGGTLGDNYLTTPFGGDKGISHINFCYYPRLSVSKTAETTFTRTWQWDIDKSVTPAAWDLFRGDSGTSEYTVSVDKTGYVDSAWSVSGSITILNDTPFPATVTGVSDVVSTALSATVDCGVTFPHDLASGESLACSYGPLALPDGTSRTNTATVTTTGAVLGGSASAPVTFGEPSTVVDGTVNVTDTNGGSWGPVSDDASWTYSKTFACDDDEGTHNNTATITETGQNDSASVEVDCYALDLDKDAGTSFTRTWDWTIDKVGDQSALTLSIGQQFLVNYTVTVGGTYVDSDFGVAGNISVYNPAPMDAVINGIEDVITPDPPVSVDCGVAFPYTLPAGETLYCTYSADLPDATDRTNTATATLQNYDYDKDLNATPGGTTDFDSDPVDIDFSTATITEIDECVDVTDDLYGFLGTVCADDLVGGVYTFSYFMMVGPYAECGDYQVVNTASFVTNDTGSTGSDGWTVDINVPCPGCTLTPGYWKTHSVYGPAPYDDTWALLGENSPFFLSGRTYYQVLWTNPAGGNAYFILAHAYIAAQLNMLDGASSTPAVDAAFAAATSLFNTYNPMTVTGLKGKGGTALRASFILLAGILDAYINGLIGPGHCSE